ncbi:LPP20 family lipoprotein [Cetobacterium sp. SF1]|uniref:LPP20 family lipoprotein n=1 Tax=Cetobacterium sp. SF1 TaxID=3417654 RepID=UPI003CEDE5CE
MRKIYSFILFFLLGSISYCAIDDWINNFSEISKEYPYKYYGIGIAKKHIRGKSEQKKLALERALEEIASQKKSQISSYIQSYETDQGSSTKSLSSKEVSNVSITSKIIEIQENIATGEIYVVVGAN